MSKGQLQSWVDAKWVRIGADGSILGSCGGRKEAEGKPKCLPEAKAKSLSKEERKKLVERKRRKDPNPDRKGKPIMVSNKLKAGGKVKKQLKPIPPGNKGLPKLPKEVRNKMGYFVEGGRAEKKKDGKIARGCGKVMSNRRKYTTIS
jgi:hypothetical protein